jgi:asparagine synthase (glutamine-hydrolysing)
MCGIAGLQVKRGAALDKNLLVALQRSLHHRGPDANGLFASGTTGLISTRLSIVDLEHGDQPLFSPRGVALVANGEIYNSPELRAQYSDYSFQTGSDCETILTLYEKFGFAFAEQLRGMYAAALYDPNSDKLVISRDPFGIKPLYYVENDDFFAFASEISALLDTGFARPDIDHQAEAELLQLKYVTGTKTIMRQVKRLDPGETIIVENASIVDRRSLPTWPRDLRNARPPRSLAAAGFSKPVLDEFSEIIEDAVKVHLRADAPWCVFYSGGIDSTILMKATQRITDKPFHALTIGYEGNEPNDESETALRLAEGANVSCERIEMGAEEFWNLTPRIAAAMDDPMADHAVLPLYMLAEAAQKRKFKIALSGEGADEIFGGYARYRRATLPSFLRPAFIRRGVFTGAPVSIAQFGDWHKDMDVIETGQAAHWKSRMQTLQAVDLLERLPNCLLIKLDRALMANGVEGRVPFLDKEVVNFAMKIPDNVKATLRYGKRLLRDWLAREYPQAQPYARKKGFEVPIVSWMRPHQTELATLLRRQRALLRYFEPTEIDAIVSGMTKEKQPVWSLLFYALWYAHHVLGIDARRDVSAVLREAAGH